MTVLNDEDLCKKLDEHAEALAEIPDFLEQVKERIELLRGEAKSAESESSGAGNELARAQEAHRRWVGAILSDVSYDQAILIDWALGAGADPSDVSGFKSSMVAGAIEARAQERSGF